MITNTRIGASGRSPNRKPAEPASATLDTGMIRDAASGTAFVEIKDEIFNTAFEFREPDASPPNLVDADFQQVDVGHASSGDVVDADFEEIDYDLPKACDFNPDPTEILKAQRKLSNRYGFLISVAKRAQTPTKEDIATEPPAAAEFIMSVCVSKKARTAMMGDLEALLRQDCKEVGLRRARLRYCGYVLHSVGPLIWRRLGKLRALALLEFARHLLFG